MMNAIMTIPFLVKMEGHGGITFSYKIESDNPGPDNGLLFFVNDFLTDLRYVPATSARTEKPNAAGDKGDWSQYSYKLSFGNYTFVWHYHQELGSYESRTTV